MDVKTRTSVKEACCRQIIKMFENTHDENKNQYALNQTNNEGGVAASGHNYEDEKVQFVKLVEPLMHTMKSDN